MIDYHCHLLPGLDDGAPTSEEALEMARALVAFGFREVCCTPHCIKGHYEISPVEVRDAVRSLQRCLDRDGIPLILHPGMEYFLDEYFEQFAANLLPLGNSRLVLCEAPPQALPGLVCTMAELIVVQGYIPLIAHPERSEVFWQILAEQWHAEEKRPYGEGEEGASLTAADRVSHEKLRSIWRRLFPFPGRRSLPPPADVPSALIHDTELPEDCLFQANLGSFAGVYGPKPQRRAYEMLQRGGYACFASDLHGPGSAAQFLETAGEKLAFNPALQKLGSFRPPEGQGGNNQLAFW